MNKLALILAQTTGPVLIIVGLLLVAGLIGYLTAWFYAKSVYTPIIRGLEDDKAQLNREISGLKDDIIKLKNEVEKQTEQIGKLEEEIDEQARKLSDRENEIFNLKQRIK